MPPMVNKFISTVPRQTYEEHHKKFILSSLTKLALLTFGSILFISIMIIVLATALTHSNWYKRRRRAWQRRMDSLTYNKYEIQDKLINYTYLVIESLSINLNEEIKPGQKSTKQNAHKYLEKVTEPIALPLRFEPEKLYGATSTIHRDNLNKAMNSSQRTNDQINRRKSMFEGIFCDLSKSDDGISRSVESWSNFKNNISIQHSHLLPNTERCFQTTNYLPQPRLSNPFSSSMEHSLSRKSLFTEDLNKGSNNMLHSLAVPVINRRASSTVYELNDKSLTSTKSAIPIEITVTDAQTDIEDLDSSLQKCSSQINVLELLTDQDITTQRRNSFVLYYQNTDRELNPLNDEHYMMRPSTSFSKRFSTIDNSTSHHSTLMKTQISDLTMLTDDNKSILHKRLPPIEVYDWNHHPAGLVALKLCRQSDEKMNLEIYAASHLNSPRPWHNANYTLRLALTGLDTSQDLVVQSKDFAFGCPQFERGAKWTIDVKSAQTEDMNIDIRIFESVKKWSGDREYYHGSVNLPMNRLLANPNALNDQINWLPVEEAYPAIRLQGDILVSLCRSHLKGFISVGIHEIRNLKILTKGKWRMEHIDSMIPNKTIEINVHICLVNAGCLIKTLKVNNTVRTSFKKRKSSKSSIGEPNPDHYQHPQSANSDYADSKYETKLHCQHKFQLNNKCFVQFVLPPTKLLYEKQMTRNNGIVIYLSSKLPIIDHLSNECVNELKKLQLPFSDQMKFVHSVGECLIGDAGFQTDQFDDQNRPQTNNSQNIMFWNDAGSRNATRIYHWLSLE